MEDRPAFPYLSEEDQKDADYEALKNLNKVGKVRFDRRSENFRLRTNARLEGQPKRGDLHVVVIGKSGEGKSATANTILGTRGVFKESNSSRAVTRKVNIKSVRHGGRTVYVADTPGLSDTENNRADTLKEIAKVMEHEEFKKGIQAFIYVKNMSNPRTTQEERDVMRLIEEQFGGKMEPFRLLVYTNAETCLEDKRLDDYVKGQKIEGDYLMKSFLDSLGEWRIVAVDNTTTVPAERARNQEEILNMVDKLVAINHMKTTDPVHEKKQLALEILQLAGLYSPDEKRVYTKGMYEKSRMVRQKYLQKASRWYGWDARVVMAILYEMERDPYTYYKEQGKFCENILNRLFNEDNRLNDNKRVREIVEEIKKGKVCWKEWFNDWWVGDDYNGLPLDPTVLRLVK